jgi:hypothetical protein
VAAYLVTVYLQQRSTDEDDFMHRSDVLEDIDVGIDPVWSFESSLSGSVLRSFSGILSNQSSFFVTHILSRSHSPLPSFKASTLSITHPLTAPFSASPETFSILSSAEPKAGRLFKAQPKCTTLPTLQESGLQAHCTQDSVCSQCDRQATLSCFADGTDSPLRLSQSGREPLAAMRRGWMKAA